MSLRAAALDDAQAIRRADPELLSLALIDARNLTLRWLEVFEARGLDGPGEAVPAPRWLAAHAGWYQERWIARHVQRARGEHADAAVPPLPSLEPFADTWFGSPGSPRSYDAQAVRRYLALTLEATLELLASAPASDDALHPYRAALRHEDRIGERLAETAALLRLAARPDPPPPWCDVAAYAPREPLWFPPQRCRLGSERAGGYVPDNERWAHDESVPEFEIDATPVTWQRYLEFVDDGGYDREELWTAEGWQWQRANGRRAPRDVEQMRGGVLVQRGGELRRAAPAQPVMHVTRHEAMAWCRWAGRRLPTEPEWELAALGGRSRGFVWGDVYEWVAGSARPWPGHASTPGSVDPLPAVCGHGVLRAASCMTPARLHHPKARRFALPEADDSFCGFRSCAQ